LITMYSRGMTIKDIEESIKVIYAVEISEGSVSNIISVVIEDIKEWQQEPLESFYFVVWIDDIVVKVNQKRKVQGKMIYLMI
jgi:putative transposase